MSKPAMIPLSKTNSSDSAVIDVLEYLQQCGFHLHVSPPPRRRRRLRRRWRITFLERFRQNDGQMVRTLEMVNVSRKLVYDEMKTESSFREAVEMVRGKCPWDERKWTRALEVAREKERDSSVESDDID